jgi:spoIIIJ-associated protein
MMTDEAKTEEVQAEEEPKTEETAQPDYPTDIASIDQEGEIAADYLEELLDIADFDGDIDTYIEAGRAHISIVGTDDNLVGKRGEVVEALQDLSRLAVMTKQGYRSRMMLDINGFRETRRKELRELGAAAVAEVKSTNSPVALAAMNPFERKIIHDVAATEGLISESEGEEPKRHVVIFPAGSK